MTLGWRSRIRLLVAFFVICAALVVWAVLRSPVTDLAARWPDPQRLEALAAYVAPAPAMPPIDDYSVHLPALPPIEVAPVAPPSPPVGPIEADWRVSAILISGGSPVAIIDDQQVRPGNRLDDGTLVERIEPTQVIVRDVQGGLHSLRVTR